MKWTEIAVFTTEQGLDAVAARFDILGVPQVMIEQGRDEIEAFLKETAKYWDFADMDELCLGEPCVKAYVADAGDNAKLVKNICASFRALKKEDVGIDLGSLRMQTRIVDDEDWANSWKVNYKPFDVGQKLMIRPSWIEDYDPRDRKVISLDPGMAFGSGTHQTTRMCLEAIERISDIGRNMLDLGCGSGILAIAALLLGAKHALCVDIDPVAEKVVHENARMNGIDDEKYEVLIGDAVTDDALREKLCGEKYGFITANIVASVIIALMPTVKTLLAPDGTFITSGIIAERLPEVIDAMKAQGLDCVEIHEDGDWRQITAKHA